MQKASKRIGLIWSILLLIAWIILDTMYNNPVQYNPRSLLFHLFAPSETSPTHRPYSITIAIHAVITPIKPTNPPSRK